MASVAGLKSGEGVHRHAVGIGVLDDGVRRHGCLVAEGECVFVIAAPISLVCELLGGWLRCREKKLAAHVIY